MSQWYMLGKQQHSWGSEFVSHHLEEKRKVGMVIDFSIWVSPITRLDKDTTKMGPGLHKIIKQPNKYIILKNK